MAFTYFVIPVDYPQPAQDELNRFLETERTITVTQHLVTTDGPARWAVCVETSSHKNTVARGVSRSDRKDYKEILNAEDFTIFAELRVLRKSLAASAGVPPYAVFNDAQLAALVTQRVRSKDAMAAIEGVGEARLRDFGEPVLQMLLRLLPEAEK